jgi:hypothetical protein
MMCPPLLPSFPCLHLWIWATPPHPGFPTVFVYSLCRILYKHLQQGIPTFFFQCPPKFKNIKVVSPLEQRFSTWGTRTPKGTRGGHRGYLKSPQGVLEEPTGGTWRANRYTQNLKTCWNEAYLGRLFYLGVREVDSILIWGYAEGYNFDLGVHKYQKVEDPCLRVNQIKTHCVFGHRGPKPDKLASLLPASRVPLGGKSSWLGTPDLQPSLDAPIY